MHRTYKVIMWDVVTRDYSKWMTAEDVVNNVKHKPAAYHLGRFIVPGNVQ